MKRKLINFIQAVNAESITTKVIDGDNHFIIPSATLPNNIVMNGGLYPTAEIDKGYKSLEGVPAPMSHPKINGKYVSAQDVRAINKFHVGAYVSNVERKNNKVYHDTVINERVALQTELGKSLIDAINKKEPIHTSTGVFLEREMLDEPMTNDAGVEYDWIARNLMHDHQAILLNETGAATPEDGVGLFVNGSTGNDEEIEVMFVNLSSGDDFTGSVNNTRQMLRDALQQLVNPMGSDRIYCYVEDFNQDTVIYESDNMLMAIQYVLSEGKITLVGEPKETTVKTVFEFNSKDEQLNIFHKLAKALGIKLKPNQTNQPKKVNTMKEQKVKMVSALNAAGVATEELTDDQLFIAHNKLVVDSALKAQPTVNALTAEDVAKIVTDTLAANEANTAKLAKTSLVESVIAANEQYTDTDKEMLLNTDAKILNGLLPEKQAERLGAGVLFGTNEQSDHALDINEMMEAK